MPDRQTDRLWPVNEACDELYEPGRGGATAGQVLVSLENKGD
jgi:hypothetical protein